ncbi:Hypothetical predicted protein [Drosophila guanche]|uniref:Uncharacterized protein n=1 Tax=Drosophila guanche TaxID=7266 RepID=A0A3B0J9J8_DROGU|nr:Hypothetical predicted protein [Drosophila guanche]
MAASTTCYGWSLFYGTILAAFAHLPYSVEALELIKQPEQRSRGAEEQRSRRVEREENQKEQRPNGDQRHFRRRAVFPLGFLSVLKLIIFGARLEVFFWGCYLTCKSD